MLNTIEFIHSLHKKGISVSLVGDLLKIEPRGLITDDLRTEIKKNKSDLIEALRRIDTDNLHGGKKSDPDPSCWHCLYFDGAGSSWPGMCQHFEQLGVVAREIDFETVNPNKGCCFFQEVVKEVAVDRKTSNQSSGIPTAAGEDRTARMPVKLPSSVAMPWLEENISALQRAGWTMADIYTGNRSKRGLAWMLVWNKPGLQVNLTGDGVVQFIFQSARGTVKQTARPNVWTQNNSNSRGAV